MNTNPDGLTHEQIRRQTRAEHQMDSTNTSRYNGLPLGPNAPKDPQARKQLVDALLLRTKAGGIKCDVCGGQREGKTTLLRCSRCGKAFYCTKACQARAWSDGHKQACRQPGKFKEGDMVRLDGLSGVYAEVNEAVVQVVSCSDRGFRVGIVGHDGTTIPVQVANMEHIRPEK